MYNSDKQWKFIYKIGAVTTIIVLCGIILDMVVGIMTGGNIAELPQTAIGRYIQFKETPLLGLYNLDLLNIINQIILIPSVFALFAVHRGTHKPTALIALILFLVGTTIFVAGNTALTMLDLSQKYFATSSEEQRTLLAAAGEAMLAKGSHGSLGVFMGFALPTFANALMSCVMLKGDIFSRANSYFGIFGNSLMVIYIIMVTLMPSVERMALVFAMPAGLLLMTWMIMFAIKLLKMSKIQIN
jgi:hypothetical protein